jgi:D-alanyl-lipoteichoic acid acyltransferase DltB (MBOAT superfamily)
MFHLFTLLAQASASNAALDKTSASNFLFYSTIALLIFSAIIGLFFWVWMLAHCLMSTRPTAQKAKWAAVIIIFNVIGALAYFTVRNQAGTEGIMSS